MKLQRKKYRIRSSYRLFQTYAFLTFFIIPVTFFGQKKEKDTSNFVSYPDKIMIRTNFSTQTDAQILEDKKGDNLYLETNNNYKLFLSVDYKFIGFSYGFYPKFIGGNNDEDEKGKSKFSEYNFRFFLGKWIQTVDYSKIKGYYVENTIDFVPNWEEGKNPYLQFPDLKIVKYGMSTSYVFNPKFSLKTVTSFTEWQKESAGSFIPTLIYDYKKLSFSTDLLSSSQNEYDISLGAGYFYNFIIHNKFYIAPNLTTSIGVKFTDTETEEAGLQTKENKNYFTTSLIGGIKMGYNSERILFGASLNFDSMAYNESQNQVVSNEKVYGLLYFGYRFDAPKFISKPINKINDKFNF
jgi:hypothetical protein